MRAKLSAKCQTVKGREIAEALEPVGSVEAIQASLDETTEAVKIYAVASPPLSGSKDIRNLLQKVKIGRALEAFELLELRATMAVMRDVKRFFKESEQEAPILKGRASQQYQGQRKCGA